MSGSVQALPRRDKNGVQDLDGPKKPPVFHDESKAELEINPVDLVLVML